MKRLKVVINRGVILMNAPTSLLLCIIVSIGLFINYYFENDVLSLICTGIAVIIILFTNRNTLNPTICYFSLFSYLFRYGAYNLSGLVTLTFIARCIISDRSVGKEACLFIPLYLLTHMLSTNMGEVNFSSVVPFINILSLYFMCHLYNRSAEQNDLCIKYFLTGHVISSIMGFLKENTRLQWILGIDWLTNIEFYDTTRYSGISFDCNFYSFVAILALMCLLLRIRSSKHPFCSIVVILFILFAGSLTYSKSFFLSAGLCLLIAFLNVSKLIRHRMLKLCIFVGIAMLFFSATVVDVFQIITNRFKNNYSMNALTTGRYSLWMMYIRLIFESLSSFIFGHGFTNRIVAAHNTFLEMLYKFGLVGCLMDVLYFFLAHRKMRQEKGHVKSITKTAIYVIFFLLLFNLSAYSFYSIAVCVFIVWIITGEYSVKEEQL